MSNVLSALLSHFTYESEPRQLLGCLPPMRFKRRRQNNLNGTEDHFLNLYLIQNGICDDILPLSPFSLFPVPLNLAFWPQLADMFRIPQYNPLPLALVRFSQWEAGSGDQKQEESEGRGIIPGGACAGPWIGCWAMDWPQHLAGSPLDTALSGLPLILLPLVPSALTELTGTHTGIGYTPSLVLFRNHAYTRENRLFIKILSNYPILMCHLFPVKILTDTILKMLARTRASLKHYHSLTESDEEKVYFFLCK